MDNTEKYNFLSEDQTSLPSFMGIIPRKEIELNGDIIKQSLMNNSDFKLISFNETETASSVPIIEKSFECEIEFENKSFKVNIDLNKNELNLQEFNFGNQIDAESLEIATKQPYFIETFFYWDEDALFSFHLQLKILNAIVNDASLVIDFSSMRLLSPKWIKMTAASPIPPSPDYLYIIHGVYDEDSNGERSYWLHTHGLHRCGFVELEIVNIKSGAEQMNTLLNMCVKRFLSNPAKEKESFLIGYDGMGINMCWLRWEEALKDLPSNILGGLDSRKDDEVHSEPSGVLLAVEDGNMLSPEIYVKTLQENPIYYISDEETARMKALAEERFYLFKELFEQKKDNSNKKKGLFKSLFKKDTNGDEDWSFLVKLGLDVDNDDSSGSGKEHLWFDVLSIEDGYINGKLLNQPYWIARLKEGDKGKYPIELLTDWIIYGPEGSYTSDNIYEISPI